MAKAAALLLLAGASASQAAVIFEEKFDSRACQPLPRAAAPRAAGIARLARRAEARTARLHAAAALHGAWRARGAPGGARFDGLLPCADLLPLRPPRTPQRRGRRSG